MSADEKCWQQLSMSIQYFFPSGRLFFIYNDSGPSRTPSLNITVWHLLCSTWPRMTITLLKLNTWCENAVGKNSFIISDMSHTLNFSWKGRRRSRTQPWTSECVVCSVRMSSHPKWLFFFFFFFQCTHCSYGYCSLHSGWKV